jgi:hypothetical protein
MLAQINEMWHTSPPLTFTTFLMLLAFAVFLPAIWLDPRLITGAPAWLKPAKFAISSVIYSGTLAWMFRYIPNWPRTIHLTGWITALVLILEVAIIALQAARGTTSHFNYSTILDRTLWGAMGSSIAILWLASIAIAIALFQQPFADQAWGLTLRLSMLITVLGSASGGLMPGPTPSQRTALQNHQPVKIIGAHTVGAPDGGPGLPATGWSREHGDLRIPHFLGLHALQLLPLLCWFLARNRTAMVVTFAASYLALFLILTWQALRGESIVQPSSATLTALGLWIVATLLSAAASA